MKYFAPHSRSVKPLICKLALKSGAICNLHIKINENPQMEMTWYLYCYFYFFLSVFLSCICCFVLCVLAPALAYGSSSCWRWGKGKIRGRAVIRQAEREPHQVHNQDPSPSLSSKPSLIMSKLSCGCKYHSPLLFEVANTRYCCLPPSSDRKSSTYVIFRSIYVKASSSFRRINTLLRGKKGGTLEDSFMQTGIIQGILINSLCNFLPRVSGVSSTQNKLFWCYHEDSCTSRGVSYFRVMALAL